VPTRMAEPDRPGRRDRRIRRDPQDRGRKRPAAGWYQTVGGQLKFKPATIEFVRWSDRLADGVLSGDVSMTDAAWLLARRSSRLSLRLPA